MTIGLKKAIKLNWNDWPFALILKVRGKNTGETKHDVSLDA